MPQAIDHRQTPAGSSAQSHIRKRPVLLATLSVRAYPVTFMLAREHMTLPHEEDLEAVRATAKRAAELGIRTELLRISSRRPVVALLELVRERDVGLLVFGPDLRRTSRLRFRIVARRVRRQAPCLVWVAPDG
jgi:nucleotide-binding universal stress UspA family protein